MNTAAGLSGSSRWRRSLLVLLMLSSAPSLALVFTGISALLPSIAAHFGGGPGGALASQMVMTAPSIGMIIGGGIAGWLIDRFGLCRLFAVGFSGYAVAGSAGFYLSDPILLVVSRGMLGVCAASIGTAVATLVGIALEGRARDRLLGFQAGLGSILSWASILGSGYAAEQWGWRAPFGFYLIAIPLLCVALLVVPGKLGKASKPVERLDRPGAGALMAMLPFYLMVIPLYAVAFLCVSQSPFLLAADGFSDPRQIAWVVSLGSLASGLAVFYGVVRTRIGARFTFTLILSLMAIGAIIAGLSHRPWGVAIGCAVMGAGSGMMTPFLIASVLRMASEAVRGRAVGAFYVALFLGEFCNPLMVYPLTSLFGLHGAFVAIGITLLASAIVSLWWTSRKNLASAIGRSAEAGAT